MDLKFVQKKPIKYFYSPKIPSIVLGKGSFVNILSWIREIKCKKVILVTTQSFIKKDFHYSKLLVFFKDENVSYKLILCKQEPNSEFIDEHILNLKNKNFDAVIGIGGGSVIDLGKSLSAMIPIGRSILNFLDGNEPFFLNPREKLPYLVIPTTSGTGGEATKNAVVTNIGPNGFKKSIRHNNLIPDNIIIDGELLTSTPIHITAACGMDALTQLIESYISQKSTPFSDAIAWSGLEYFLCNFDYVCINDSNNIEVRQAVAYSALCSGIALANADLGIVHGIAVPIGGFFKIPHGEVCARLLSASLKVNFNALESRDNLNPSLLKLIKISKFIDNINLNSKPSNKIDSLINKIDIWINKFKIPTLDYYKITKKDIPKIISKTSQRNNPITLNENEIEKIIKLSI